MGSSASTPHSEPAASILWTLRTATERASVAAPTRSGVGVLYAFAPTPPLLDIGDAASDASLMSVARFASTSQAREVPLRILGTNHRATNRKFGCTADGNRPVRPVLTGRRRPPTDRDFRSFPGISRPCRRAGTAFRGTTGGKNMVLATPRRKR